MMHGLKKKNQKRKISWNKVKMTIQHTKKHTHRGIPFSPSGTHLNQTGEELFILSTTFKNESWKNTNKLFSDTTQNFGKIRTNETPPQNMGQNFKNQSRNYLNRNKENIYKESTNLRVGSCGVTELWPN